MVRGRRAPCPPEPDGKPPAGGGQDTDAVMRLGGDRPTRLPLIAGPTRCTPLTCRPALEPFEYVAGKMPDFGLAGPQPSDAISASRQRALDGAGRHSMPWPLPRRSGACDGSPILSQRTKLLMQPNHLPPKHLPPEHLPKQLLPPLRRHRLRLLWPACFVIFFAWFLLADRRRRITRFPASRLASTPTRWRPAGAPAISPPPSCNVFLSGSDLAYYGSLYPGRASGACFVSCSACPAIRGRTKKTYT